MPSVRTCRRYRRHALLRTLSVYSDEFGHDFERGTGSRFLQLAFHTRFAKESDRAWVDVDADGPVFVEVAQKHLADAAPTTAEIE